MEKQFSTILRNFIYLTILSIIVSCSSNEKIEGTWIGAYSYSDESESSLILPIRVVVSFQNDSYLSRSFKYDYRSEKNIEKGNFSYNGKKIVYDSNDEKNDIIQLLNNDSLVIKGYQGSNHSVYKKLDNSLKNNSKNVNLIGKSFLIKSVKYNDTLNFLNDSLFTSSSDKFRNSKSKWERVKQKGFDIIFMQLNVPMIIQEKINDTIYMTALHKKRHNFKLIELKRMPTSYNSK